jgi:Cu-Zn family superoxide dismutase
VGQATLTEARGGARVVVDVVGLPPGAKGFHVHEVGRCEPPSFESASGHFNPTGKEHATANPRGPHAGDLPNITIDASGAGHLDVTTDRITLRPGPPSVFDAGGSAIIARRSDDMRSDPAGNSAAAGSPAG